MSGFSKLSLAVDKPVKMELTHPATGVAISDKDGNPAYIEVLSTDSQVAQKRRRQSKKRLMEQLQKGKRINYSVEQSEEDDIATLVSCTTGWYLLDLDGQPLEDVEYNEKNAKILYTENALTWIKDQVQEFITDRANFTNS